MIKEQAIYGFNPLGDFFMRNLALDAIEGWTHGEPRVNHRNGIKMSAEKKDYKIEAFEGSTRQTDPNQEYADHLRKMQGKTPENQKYAQAFRLEEQKLRAELGQIAVGAGREVPFGQVRDSLRTKMQANTAAGTFQTPGQTFRGSATVVGRMSDAPRVIDRGVVGPTTDESWLQRHWKLATAAVVTPIVATAAALGMKVAIESGSFQRPEDGQASNPPAEVAGISPEPTKIPTTPESTLTVKPTATVEPTAAVLTPEQMILKSAEFPENAKLSTTDGKYVVMYSQGILDAINRTSISAPQGAMDNAYRVLLNNAYSLSGVTSGSVVELGEYGTRGGEIVATRLISGTIEAINQYTVTPDEFDEIRGLFGDSQVERLETPDMTSQRVDSVMYFNGSTLVIVRRAGGLDNFDEDKIEQEVISHGPASTYLVLTTTIALGNNTFKVMRFTPDPIYDSLGCTPSQGCKNSVIELGE
ncbi:MAG: hypothetical protein AAB656_00245 [Patescibacteria group bacterium]